YLKDGDGDGNSQCAAPQISSVKASANSDVMYFFTSAQDGDLLQDDVRLCLGDDLKKAQDHILEEYCITLKLSLQHNNEQMACNESWKKNDASLITDINNKSFEINYLKAQLQEKSIVVNELQQKNTSIGARDTRFGRGKQAKEESQGQLWRNYPAGVTP
ncbi:hypothetical protein Tco_1059285, partial [Tanacetum coccineum]